MTTLVRACACVAAIGCTSALASRADAQEGHGKTATLGWARLDGAESCIATQDLAQAVEKLLGRAVFVSASAAELAIEGRVEKKADGSGYFAVLSVADAKGASLGSRRIETGADCAGLNESVELSIALMIDPDAQLGAKPPDVPPPPPDPPVDVPPPKVVYVPVPAPPPAPLPAQKTPWKGDILSGFALGFGLLPPPVSPGAFGGASLTPPGFVPLEGTLTFFAPFDEEAAHGALVTFYALQGGGFLCPLEFEGSIGGVRACGGLTGGFIVADGQGFDTKDPDESGLYGTLGASLRGRGTVRVYQLLHLGFAAEMTVPFIRPEFVYTERSGEAVRLFQPSPVLGTLQAFARLAFP